jgi:hypothetical protein
MSPEQAEIDVSEDYLIGLLDFLTNPTLSPRETSGGYSLDAGASISVRDSPLLTEILSQSLSARGIDTRRSNADSTSRRLKVTNTESIEALGQFGAGKFLQIGERIAYLSKFVNEYSGKNTGKNSQLFLGLFEPWADLHPYWKDQTGRKYTTEYFKQELDVQSPTELFQVPTPDFPEEISTEYVAGLFDAKGRIRLNLSQNAQWDIGYAMSPSIEITISHPRILVKPHLLNYWKNPDYSPNVQELDGKLTVTIAKLDEIEAFIEDIGPHLYYNYELAEFFYSQAIPAFRDGYHRRSREGYLDLVESYERVLPSNTSKKYEAAYFREEWDID